MEPAPVRLTPLPRDACLQAAFAALPEAVALARHPDHVVLDASDALLDLLGARREDVVGHVLRLPHEEEGRALVLPTGHAAPRTVPWRLRRADGAVLDALVTTRPLAPDAEPLGLLVMVRPTAGARPDADPALHEQALLARAVPAYVFTVARDGTILAINRVAPGLRVEDVVGRNQYDSLAPEDRERARALQESVFETGQPVRYEVRSDVVGGMRWYENHVSPVVERGRVRALVVLTLDVTERKLAEEKADRTTRLVTSLLDASQRLASELDAERVVQATTDAARVLTGAAFGAFFYNVEDGPDRRYTLYALSGAPREAFDKFPMPRATALFGPTFRGERTVRLDDVTRSDAYGRSPPHHGMPRGHLPVRSYLAVPVVSRAGTVHGGLFFGHPDPDVFTAEAQALAEGLAAQAAIALDNAALYRAARDSEARFRVLADTMPQMVWYTTPEGEVEWANRRWHEYTGQSEAEVRGSGWLGVLHPDDRERTMRAWRDATKEGESYEMTYRLRRAGDGAYRWHLGRASPMRDEAGRVLRWFGTSTDVHDQHVAAQRLRESEERYRFLADNLGDVIARSTLDGLFLDATPASLHVLGYAPEELVGRRVYDLVEEADHDLVRGARATLTRGEREYVIQVRGIKKGGERVWLEVHGLAVRDAAGHPMEVISSIRDVTGRKLAETALRESEERFRRLSASSPVGIFLADPSGRALYVNPACMRICGFRGDAALGDGWLASVHAEDRARVQREWAAYAARGKGEHFSAFRWVHPDGTVCWSHVRAAPLLTESGEVTGHVGTVEDVTPLKLAAQELERTRAELVHSEKMSALGSLVAGVAHELRTPLTYLGTNLDLVERAVGRLLADLPEERRRAAHARLAPRLMDAREGMDRINRLVEDLRRFTKLRAAGERQMLDLAPIVDEAVGLFRATRRGDVRVEDDLRPTRVRMLDRVQVQQVVLNLLENAREARPRDGVVRVRTFTDDEGRPVLEVEDKGPGIPAEVAARMWDPFFTTKPEGSGLGLAIVKRIADAHGATVACRSAPGEGTTFRIAF